MACFIAPAAEAVIISIVKKNEEKKEKAAMMNGEAVSQDRISWSRKLGWLTRMLWGGVFLLAIEHIWHGEVVLYPPFLTAMNNPADIMPMLTEIMTVGGSMVLFVTLVWYVMTLVADHIYQRSSAAETAAD